MGRIAILAIDYNMPIERYVCPDCGSHLVWTHHGKNETASRVVCGNNPTSSRADFKFESAHFCFWVGVCYRDKSGNIILKNSDGTLLRGRWVKEDGY